MMYGNSAANNLASLDQQSGPHPVVVRRRHPPPAGRAVNAGVILAARAVTYCAGWLELSPCNDQRPGYAGSVRLQLRDRPAAGKLAPAVLAGLIAAGCGTLHPLA